MESLEMYWGRHRCGKSSNLRNLQICTVNSLQITVTVLTFEGISESTGSYCVSCVAPLKPAISNANSCMTHWCVTKLSALCISQGCMNDFCYAIFWCGRAVEEVVDASVSHLLGGQITGWFKGYSLVMHPFSIRNQFHQDQMKGFV